MTPLFKFYWAGNLQFWLFPNKQTVKLNESSAVHVLKMFQVESIKLNRNRTVTRCYCANSLTVKILTLQTEKIKNEPNTCFCYFHWGPTVKLLWRNFSTLNSTDSRLSTGITSAIFHSYLSVTHCPLIHRQASKLKHSSFHPAPVTSSQPWLM